LFLKIVLDTSKYEEAECNMCCDWKTEKNWW